MDGSKQTQTAAKRGSILQGMAKEEISWVLMQQKSSLLIQSSLYHLDSSSVGIVASSTKKNIEALPVKFIYKSSKEGKSSDIISHCNGVVCTSGKSYDHIG